MLRVLVADDDPGIVRTLMLGLKMMGCQPVGVESAEAAIKALEDKSADLLLTDMRMEGMSGVDLVRDAHARWPEMICVVMMPQCSCPARRDRARPSWLGPSIEDRHVRTSRLWK